MKSAGLIVLPFIGACCVTYFVIRSQRAAVPEKKRDDTITGVRGLNEGEIVSLPALMSMAGQSVDLSKSKQTRILCSFINASCSGCVLDSDFWRQLHQQSLKTDVAFYLVEVGSDRSAVEKFIASYKLQDLPVLFDPINRIGPKFRIGLVPQYVLFSADGKVLHRWDGIRQNDHRKDSEKVAEFFYAYY